MTIKAFWARRSRGYSGLGLDFDHFSRFSRRLTAPRTSCDATGIVPCLPHADWGIVYRPAAHPLNPPALPPTQPTHPHPPVAAAIRYPGSPDQVHADGAPKEREASVVGKATALTAGGGGPVVTKKATSCGAHLKYTRFFGSPCVASPPSLPPP